MFIPADFAEQSEEVLRLSQVTSVQLCPDAERRGIARSASSCNLSTFDALCVDSLGM
jgi:hypothetical protein